MSTMKVEMVVPDWVHWIAVDENGEVWYYKYEPKKVLEFGYWWANSDSAFEKTNEKAYVGKPPKNWEDELYEWK